MQRICPDVAMGGWGLKWLWRDGSECGCGVEEGSGWWGDGGGGGSGGGGGGGGR